MNVYQKTRGDKVERVKKLKSLVGHQIKMNLKSMWKYKVSFLAEIVLLVGVYFLIVYINDFNIIGNYYKVDKDKAKILLLIGYLMWQFSVIALGISSSAITTELKEGTLETKIQGIYPLSFLYFIEVIVNITYSFVIILILLIVTYINLNILEVSRILKAMLFMLPSILGMYGMGLTLSGLTFKHRNIGQLRFLIQNILLFFSNITNPNIANWQKIIPFTEGISLGRQYYIDGILSIKEINIYISVNIIWLFLGVFIFNKSLRATMKNGSFDKY